MCFYLYTYKMKASINQSIFNLFFFLSRLLICIKKYAAYLLYLSFEDYNTENLNLLKKKILQISQIKIIRYNNFYFLGQN